MSHATATPGPAVWTLFAAIAVYAAFWAGSAITRGLPGLYQPAVAKVPLMFLVLAVISRG